MGIFTRKKKKLNKAEPGGSEESTAPAPITTEETSGGAPSRTSDSPDVQLSETASKNIAIPSKTSSLSPTVEHSESFINSVELASSKCSGNPDHGPPLYPESPPISQKSAIQQVSRPCCSRRPKSVEPSNNKVRVYSARSKSSVRSESPTKSSRSGSPASSPRSYPQKSASSESPGRCPGPKCPAKSSRSESPGKCLRSKCPAKSPRSGSPAEASKSKNKGWPTRAGVPRKGGNLEAVFCCGEQVFGTCVAAANARLAENSSGGEDASSSIFPSTWKSVTMSEQARSEETFLSATEKSHNGYHTSDTSRTTTTCSEVCGDDEYDESSCDECESEMTTCQVQCCCISCCPPPDTCNFFRIPPPMPCQQFFQQNGPCCGCCGDARPARTVGNDCCRPVVECPSCCRPKSRELRGSILIMGCYCNRKNGLQDDCPRTGCQGSSQCSTQPQPSCDNQQFSQGKHLEEKWEKEQKTEMKVCYCSSYKSAFGPKTRCGPSCTIKVTKQETTTTSKQEIQRQAPQRCQNGDGNHCPEGCANWCNCDMRLNPKMTCYTPPRIVPNIPQLSSGYSIPCVNPMFGMLCHTNNCDPDSGGCR